jgi:hypothetical protein
MAQPAGNAVTGSPKDNAATRAAQYTANCVYNNFPATRSDAIACRNYLITAGNSYCDVPADDEYAVLCTSGNSEILGWNYYNVSGALLAYCSDTAVGASWVIDQCSTCTADNCAVEGMFNRSLYVCKSALLTRLIGSQTASGSDVYVVYIGQSV